MLLRITAKRQVTFPARVLDELGVKPGDEIELQEAPRGYLILSRHVETESSEIDYSALGALRDKIKPGAPPFDIRTFRDEGYDPTPYRD